MTEEQERWFNRSTWYFVVMICLVVLVLALSPWS